MGANDVIYIGQEIFIQPPQPSTVTPENQPGINTVSPTITNQAIKKTSSPFLIEETENNHSADMNLYFLLFLRSLGSG